MRAINYAFMALYTLPAKAAWQTVYNSNFSMVYIQSVNGSLYQLPITDKNVTISEIGAEIKPLAPAPANATILLDNDDHLFAVWGSKGCGSAPIEISQYDHEANQWNTVAQSNMRTQNWHQDSQTVWLDRSTEEIYIYGGDCNGDTRKGFYRYNLGNGTFQEVDSAGRIMPREMSAAQAIPLSDYETLILGGRSGNAWVSMQQIAIWGHGSWTFNPVDNSTGVDSRENPLLLPIWTYGQNGSSSSINDILVLGGSVADRPSKPEIALLKRTETAGWYWTVPSDENDINVAYAATTLYGTLANLNGPQQAGSASSQGSVSSSPAGRIDLFSSEGNKNQWLPVKSVTVTKTPTEPRQANSKSSTSTATIAVVSTLLPVIFICLVGICAWWFWRKRRQRRLFLLPNKRIMLSRQRSTHSSTNSSEYWPSSSQLPLSSTSIPPLPNNDPDSGSVMMMESSGGNRLFMSKQRRSLHVVNPDNDDERQGSRDGSRESSWSSSSKVSPFSDPVERKSEFDFGI